MKTMTSVRNVLAAWGLCLVAALALTVSTAEARNPKINVAVGQSVTQSVPVLIKTVSIADSKVADVVVAGPREILVNGKHTGFTTVVVWDENNVSTIYNVVVRGAFSDQKIELRVQVAELDKQKLLELGVDWLWGKQGANNAWIGGSYGGKVATPSIPLQIFGDNDLRRAEGGAEGVDLAVGWTDGIHRVTAMLKAMQADGVARILAEPNVVASSGQPASFLSGGEFPVPIAQGGSGAGATTITIEYKEFGIKVDFLPTIVDSGVINLKVAPEVSRLDYANAIQLAGATIPSIAIRRAETTVELNDGQVLVIGGLLFETETKVTSRVPILGHIPLIGLLFSSTRNETTQQELLIVVSPHIIHALPRGTEVALPGVPEEKEEG
jgi:pilus assembly protein CpaC